MDAKGAQPPINMRIVRLADAQHGVVARRQLIALGVGRGAIGARVRNGLLTPVWRGVFAVGRKRLPQEARWMAAVLACGEGAVLSHRAAGALWGMLRGPGPGIDVTVPRANRSQGGAALSVHRSARLTPAEVTRRLGIPVTRPARTLIDLAEVLSSRELDRALHETERLGRCSDRQVRAAIALHPGRAGTGRLATALDGHDAGSSATATDLEDRFIAICDRFGIPTPGVNQRLGRYKTDFRWDAERLIVETDGRQSHLTTRAFESDHERDTELTTSGWRVLRFTWRQLTERPDWVARKVHEALALGRGR